MHMHRVDLDDGVKLLADAGEFTVSLIAVDVAMRRHVEPALVRHQTFEVASVGCAAIHPALAIPAKEMAAPHTVDSGKQRSLVTSQTQHARALADFPQVAPALAAVVDVHARRAGRRLILEIALGNNPVPAARAGIEAALVNDQGLH